MIYRCKSLFKDENNYFYRVFTILVDQISMHVHEQSSCWAWAGVSLFWGQFIFGLCKCILFFFLLPKKNLIVLWKICYLDSKLLKSIIDWPTTERLWALFGGQWSRNRGIWLLAQRKIEINELVRYQGCLHLHMT